MTHYFAVIGNRDHIKIQGEKRPFWEFLNTPPDGWLTSLVYHREDVPTDRPQIWDCGAWSYKDERLPKLGAERLTPAVALARYADHAAPGAFVIAPDHMLIEREGIDLNHRRTYNRRSAAVFLRKSRAAGFRPMATVHGMDLDERVGHARTLASLGYDALAIGGIAARASQKRLVLEMVEAIRDAVPEVWLHVLGLSSPGYFRAWHALGVESCDGASHFKQAFTGGAFFTVEGERLKKHQAARTDRETGEVIGEVPDVSCDCTACRKLREEGIDTRTYGSNEHNMGRAAHNLNMLMRAQRAAVLPTVHLVSCVGEKAPEPRPARELYRSDWFRKARAYVEAQGTPWFILSALHGLVTPEEVVAPYEQTLNYMSSDDRRSWGEHVARTLLWAYPEPTHFVILAGKHYRYYVAPVLAAAGHHVEVPMEGLGIGQQLAWLKERTNDQLTLGL